MVMKTTIKTKQLNIAFIIIAVFSLSLIGCSSEDDTSAKTNFDHAHDNNVTDLVKHKFEHEFADQCVARELKTSVNKSYDKQRYAETCLCIESEMMHDLTAEEAEKFLNENKNTRSLQIRFDAAAYHCLQSKAPPKNPTIFINRPKNKTQ